MGGLRLVSKLGRLEHLGHQKLTGKERHILLPRRLSAVYLRVELACRNALHFDECIRDVMQRNARVLGPILPVRMQSESIFQLVLYIVGDSNLANSGSVWQAETLCEKGIKGTNQCL